MTTKTKNPLYVVKGKTVHPAENIWEYVVERLNLRPLIKILNQILEMVLASVKDYPTFLFAKNFIDQLTEKIQQLRAKFQL